MNRFLSKNNSIQLLEFINQSSLLFEYESERHRINIKDEINNDILYFRLPIIIPFPQDLPFQKEIQVNYIILLIQSGSCALGYFENEVNIDHKIFKSYMVRMKQGKSQIKYLKTRGKSKAGSRVRLGETVDFFENINQRLQDYFEQFNIDRVAISCSKILIPYLYNSKISTPFGKGDERLLKIPKHIHLPNFEVLMDVQKFLLKGEIIWEENDHPLVKKLLEKLEEIEGQE